MGTHVCALPAGDHCSRGLVCLGCTHAQPKKSATPIFRRMLLSHRRALAEGRRHSEPNGQLAARELEITRIEGAITPRRGAPQRRRRRNRRSSRVTQCPRFPYGCGPDPL